ncbi:hypothetical protein D3C80_2013020 [compost metagenome]
MNRKSLTCWLDMPSASSLSTEISRDVSSSGSHGELSAASSSASQRVAGASEKSSTVASADISPKPSSSMSRRTSLTSRPN